MSMISNDVSAEGSSGLSVLQKRNIIAASMPDDRSLVGRFLSEPGKFAPSSLATKAAYQQFVLQEQDGLSLLEAFKKVETGEFDERRIRNVGVALGLTGGRGGDQSVLILSAEVLCSSSQWEKKTSTGVGFVFKEWVQEKAG